MAEEGAEAEDGGSIAGGDVGGVVDHDSTVRDSIEAWKLILMEIEPSQVPRPNDLKKSMPQLTDKLGPKIIVFNNFHINKYTYYISNLKDLFG